MAGWIIKDGVANSSLSSLIVDDTTTNATMYPVWVTGTSGNLPLKVSSTKLTLNPSTGLLTTTTFATTSLQFTSNQINQVSSNSDTAEIAVSYVGYQSGTTKFRDFTIYDGKNNSIMAATGSTKAVTFSGSIRSTIATLTDAATVAVDLASKDFKLVLGGNRTLGFPTNFPNSAQDGCITILQDSTGSRTLAYAWCYQFQGSAPVLSTGKYTIDQLYYRTNHYLTGTITMTIATPCVVTWTAHGLISGYRVQFTTTGALPTGLSASTTYWVNVVDANTFNLSSSLANLQAGTYIATSGSQSGTHTAISSSITIGAKLGLV